MKIILIVFAQMLCQVLADQHQQIFEHQIYSDLHQDARSYAYYKLTVGERYYVTKKEHLTIKVVADSYQSDPDVFISRNETYPTSSTNSEWYCQRVGSETCIIHNGEFAIGDTLYIGVACVQECDYSLRAWFTNEIDLTESSRTQMRFDAFSTQILKYYIPFETEDSALTSSMEIIISPEDKFVHLDAHLSLDANFYLIEEKPASHIVANGIAIKFTEKDYEWCRKCYVYVIVNIYKEMRYYITSIARRENDPLNEALATEIMVNPFQQECYEYFILRTKEDVQFFVSGYTGHADAYIQARDIPESPQSERILMRGAHGPSKSMILKIDDRQRAGYSTGTYNLCFYAYSPFSALITTVEKEFNDLYDFVDGEIMTQSLSPKGYSQGRYTNSELRQRGKLKVHLDIQSGEGLPKVYYKMCNSQALVDCTLDENEVHGQGMTELKDMDEDTGLVSHLTAEIEHIPENCDNSALCYYMFSVSNKARDKTYIYSMRIELEFYDPGNVDLEKTYQNVVQHGQFIRHEISPKTNPNMIYLRKLSIKLTSLQGDADIFVSFGNPNPSAEEHDLNSRRTTAIDEVIIENSGGVNHFERTIFFTIYGSTRTQYFVEFEYEYLAIYNERLEQSIAIGDGQYLYQNFADEYQEGFYSFKPWWSGVEKRTVVLLADVISNKVFFYSQWNDFPKHFLTTKHDQNDTITYHSGEEHYHSRGGSYYIRLRPDYALYDLLSAREYMFNMYTFSQPPANGSDTMVRNGWDTLELGKNSIGYANNSDYQDYRYFMVDMKGDYNVTLQRMPGQGKPIFFVKMMDSTSGSAARSEAYHFVSEEHPIMPDYIQNLTITNDMRRSRWSKCGSLLHTLQADGRQLCFISISVRCGSGEDCAYNLKIEQIGVDSSIVHSSRPTETFTPTPPGPILSEEFVNGEVTYNKTKYYYFPVDREDYGNSLIFLNKTQIYSTGENGDSRMLVNLQNDTETQAGADYKTWIYPTDKRAGAITSTKNNTWPEIIDPNQQIMERLCKNADGCSFIIGVAGGTLNKKSSYRIKGFRGYNKLHMNKPIVKTAEFDRKDNKAYDYYWFVINDTVREPNAEFQYQVSVGSETGNDPDLFVSVMDGRYPVAEDCDFSSNMNGADSVQIRSNDTFWHLNGWNTSAGVVVVVGVRMREAGNYTLVLSSQMHTLRTLPLQRIDVGQSVEVSLDQYEGVREYNHLFQLFNWGHKDIQLSMDVTQGSAIIMYNQAGQRELNTNIFTGIPYNAENSREYREVDTEYNERNSIININGDQCFGCWYFIRIRVVDNATTTYLFTVSENSDSGGPAEIKTGTFQQIYILSALDASRKFLLKSMDNFILEATVVTGEVTMYVGLDPDTVGPDNYLWTSKSEGGVAALAIKTTDDKFHMATWYYVKMFSNDFQDTLMNLNLMQQTSVDFIPNNHDSTYSLTHAEFNDQLLYEKFQFQSVQEHVKFHVFQVPGAKLLSNGKAEETYYRAKININSLTPHFYPMIYIKKIELAQQPTELSSLTFPTIADYFKSFGEDPLSQVYSSEFEYTFTNFSSQLYTYYTMAVYENNWGLTEQRKSEYQIKVEADVIDLCEAIDCGVEEEEPAQGVNVEAEKFVLHQTLEEDGSLWKWIDLEAKIAEERILEEIRQAEQAAYEAEQAAILAAEEAAREAEEAALEAEEEIMQIIMDSAEMGEDIAILAEEEAADNVEFDQDGNIVQQEDQSIEQEIEEDESTEEKKQDDSSTQDAQPEENIEDESTDDQTSEEEAQEDEIEASSEESAESKDENQSTLFNLFESWEIPSFLQLLGYKQ